MEMNPTQFIVRVQTGCNWKSIDKGNVTRITTIVGGRCLKSHFLQNKSDLFHLTLHCYTQIL